MKTRIMALAKVLPVTAVVLLVAAASEPQAEPFTRPKAAVAAALSAPAEPAGEVRPAIPKTEPVAGQLFPERQPHAGVRQDLFRGHQWYTPPPRPKPARQAAVPVRQEPRAPALPYKLLGIYEQQGSEPLYLLVRDDRIFEVSIGDSLEENYKVDGVSNGQLMLTYLPLNTSQGIRLGEQQ